MFVMPRSLEECECFAFPYNPCSINLPSSAIPGINLAALELLSLKAPRLLD
jgi:hypothetical protein